MSKEQRGVEWKVGLFVLIGLTVIAVMAVKFGKVGKGLEKTYSLTVEFPNASGLIKGAEVYLAGAPVGYVEQSPTLIEGRYAVKVPLKIRAAIRVPKGSNIVIGSSGLMGDAYVSIDPPPDANPDLALADGDYVVGNRVKGLGDAAAAASGAVDELQKRLQELQKPISDVTTRLLSEQNLKNLEESFANIRDMTASLKRTAGGLDEVVGKAKEAAVTLKEAMDTAKGAMTKADGVMVKVDSAASDLKGAIADIRDTAVTATKAMDGLRTLMAKANSGQGALGVLLNDKEAASNLKELVRNLKERGILWYKDKPKQ